MRMRGLLRIRLFSLLVTALLTLSVSAAAWAHRAPSADEEALRAFFLSGGSYGDLCGGQDHAGAGGDDCPLCRLHDATVLPGAPLAPAQSAQGQGVPLAAPVWTAPFLTVTGPAHGARAPPSV